MKNKLFILIAVIAIAGVLLCVLFCGDKDHEKPTDGKATGVEEPEGRTEVAISADESGFLEMSAVYMMADAPEVSEVSSEPSTVHSRSVDKVMKSVVGLETSGKTVLGGRRGLAKGKAFDGTRGDMEIVTSEPKSSIKIRDHHEHGDTDESNNRKSGLLTAGEWNDLDHWSFWDGIINDNEFSGKTDYWKFFPKKLVAVKVVDANNVGVANASVILINGKNVEFTTRTDNAGYAYCWIGLTDGDANDTQVKNLTLIVGSSVVKAQPAITSKGDKQLNMNVVALKNPRRARAKADVAFIVDATGSMKDEINFLKSDLSYIIDHASSESKVPLRTATVFYRDVGDVFLTRHHDFSENMSEIQKYVSEQDANDGGDYPEAVHSALETALQKLSWDESARARVAFLILDAPAHHEDGVIKSLQKSIKLFAKNGIKVIPVAASGIDKDTEFMLRFFDLATGGTYVFLTDDSGIGNSHIKATVGDHKVEKLADLMVRLIKKYVE
ncbi:MAG: VWA domain-containing protein [Fibrobacter sp.]|nr:VWA domain-containing protein [Fibrobacter sp.]